MITYKQLNRINPYFPRSHGNPQVDDRRVISGILYVVKNGLRWKDAPRAYGLHKTPYNRFVRWSRMGVFNRILSALAGEVDEPDRLTIDAPHLKAHRTAASLLKRLFPAARDRSLHPAKKQPQETDRLRQDHLQATS